jgi:hypothetical protein
VAIEGGSIRVAGGRIWIRDGRLMVAFKDATGKWCQHRTPLRPGQEADAERLLREIHEALASGTAWTARPHTVGSYAAAWIEGRKSHIASWKDDQARLKQHVFLPSATC